MRGNKQGYRGQMSNPSQTWNSGYYSGLAAKYSLITPSINIYYKNAFNFQGGWMRDLTNYGILKHGKWYPFVNLTVAPLSFDVNNGPGVNWKLYGSYCNGGYLFDYTFNLSDFAIDPASDPATDPTIRTQPIAFYTSGMQPTYYLYGITDSAFWIAHIGTSLSFLNNRLQLSYAFEKRKYFPQAYIPNPYGSNFIVYVLEYIPSSSVTHHMAFTGKILDGPKLKWITQLNSTIITNKYLYNVNYVKALYSIGDIQHVSRS